MIFGGRISISHKYCNQNLKLKANQSLLKIKVRAPLLKDSGSL